ncbi:InlB B-repeat-containing protein, partial [Microbispora sp. H10836]|uniref:DUF7379 domain-containing protein n=1 Tax=Microbispora sp. H10836 TaxID=2729106 RepID=UPI002892B5E0
MAASGDVKLIDFGSGGVSEGTYVGRVNNKGQIATQKTVASGPRAVLLSVKDGSPQTTDIHSSLGIEGASSFASEVNDDGTVVGQVDHGGSFLFKDGTVTFFSPRNAIAINNKGQVAGSDNGGWVRDPDGSVLRLRAFDLQHMEISSLNDSGSVVGVADMDPDPFNLKLRAFRTKPGEPLDVSRDSLPWGEATAAHDINNKGEVAGYGKNSAGGYVPIIWDKNGVAHEKTTANGGKALAINNAGVAVGELYGSSSGLGYQRAALYVGNTTIDLNSLVPPGTTLTLRQATGINDLNQVTGIGQVGGEYRPFLLDLGQAFPTIESIVFQTRVYPSKDWVDLPFNWAIDGNTVRVNVVVRNDSDYPAATNLQLLENVSGKSLLKSGVPEIDVTLAPHETRTIPVDWNTASFAWHGGQAHSGRSVTAKLLAGAVEREHRTEALTVRPKPFILVHGYRSSAQKAWGSYQTLLSDAHPLLKGYAVGDGQVPGTLNTGDPAHPTERTYTMQQNAEQLETYIEGVRAKTGAWHVDVLAHSMGGVITRKYIQDYMPGVWDDRPVVNRMLQMGTPNLGSPCADVAARLRPKMHWPATLELTTTHMTEIFNKDVHRLRGVLPSALVGVKRGVVCDWFGGDPAKPTKEDGDSIVPVSSASFDYTDIKTTESSHVRMTTSVKDFEGYVKERLAKSLAGTSGSVELAPQGGELAPQVQAHAGVKAAADGGAASESPSSFAMPSTAVEPGKTVSVPLDVPQGTAFGVTAVLPETVGMLLRDPSGKPAASYAAGSEAAEQPIQGLSVAKPQAGAWKLEITNTAAEAVTADVLAWVAGSPVKAAATAKAADDGRVTVTAKVTDDGQPVTGVPVKAVLTAEDTTSVELTLQDGGAGDGVYGATSEPLADGVYSVLVQAETAKGLRDTHTVIQIKKPDTREFELTLSAQPGGSASASPAQDTYRAGTKVTLTATPEAGRIPTGWTVDGEDRPAGKLMLIMDGPHTVVARFGTYTVTEIGGLPGGNGASTTTAVALNDRGQVAATTMKDGKNHAVRWQAGEITDLGGPPCTGACAAEATGINEDGDVSGSATATVEDRNESHAVVYGRDGSVKDLHPTGQPANTNSYANDLNDSGQVFGWIGDSYMMWEGGTPVRLPDAPEWGTAHVGGMANRINNQGTVAGGYVSQRNVFGVPIEWRPAYYQDGVTTKLEVPACDGPGGGIAFAVNNPGVIAGEWNCMGEERHAYTWQNGRPTDLGAGTAAAINDSGLVAGFAGAGAGVPALWLDGAVHELPELLPRPMCPADRSKTTEPCMALHTLRDLNSSGQILMQGFVRDRAADSDGFTESARSFLLSPTKAQADLQVTAEVSASEPGPGSKVTWTATVTNKGDDPATDVRLDVLVPQAAGVSTCETFRGICAPIKDGFRNTVKVLEPGWSARVEVTSAIPADAADGTELKVQAFGYSLAVA